MSMTTYKINNFEEKFKEKYGSLRNNIFNNFEIHWHEELSSTMDLVNKNISNKENLNHIIKEMVMAGMKENGTLKKIKIC